MLIGNFDLGLIEDDVGTVSEAILRTIDLVGYCKFALVLLRLLRELLNEPLSFFFLQPRLFLGSKCPWAFASIHYQLTYLTIELLGQEVS